MKEFRGILAATCGAREEAWCDCATPEERAACAACCDIPAVEVDPLHLFRVGATSTLCEKPLAGTWRTSAPAAWEAWAKSRCPGCLAIADLADAVANVMQTESYSVTAEDLRGSEPGYWLRSYRLDPEGERGRALAAASPDLAARVLAFRKAPPAVSAAIVHTYPPASPPPEAAVTAHLSVPPIPTPALVPQSPYDDGLTMVYP